MITIDSNHPDLEDFIEIKTDLESVTKANISIKAYDNLFKEALNHKKHKLYYKREETGEVIEKEVDAKKILQLIAKTNWDYGEPGIVFWDKVKNWNLASNNEDFKLVTTNP